MDDRAAKHIARREQDEFACAKCGKRWDVGEEAPECTPPKGTVKRDALFAPSTDKFI
jgi:hypothetical protein